MARRPRIDSAAAAVATMAAAARDLSPPDHVHLRPSTTGHSIEAVGVGAAVTGLIGVIKSPSQASSTSTVQNADTVNQGAQS